MTEFPGTRQNASGAIVFEIKGLEIGRVNDWLGDEDSNLDRQSQSLSSCH